MTGVQTCALPISRGNEAVHYVDNIRRYYDTLVWVDNQNKALEDEQALIKESQIAEQLGQEVKELSGAQPQ